MTVEAKQSAGDRLARRYRIDFALTVLVGNKMRYLLLRPIVERDRTVRARWYPIRTWFADDPLRCLPGHLRIRLRHVLDSLPLYLKPPSDAVVIHAFETYYAYAILRRLLRRKTIIVNNSDAGLHGLSRLGKRLTAFAIRETDLFIPWSMWAASEIQRVYPWIPADRFLVLHPGIDIRRWPLRLPKTPGERFQLLFVGGDLLRKGADTLLDAYERHLATTCDLHIATQSGYLAYYAPAALRERIDRLPGVTLHLDLEPNSEPLQALYRSCDAFVLPTNGDASPWVALEAMATGLPVIITPVGAIPEIVRDGQTGLLIPGRDPAALAAAVERVQTDATLRTRLIAHGRAHVEEHFDAEKNTQRMLAAIKLLVDQRQAPQLSSQVSAGATI
jgi:glycosyltransferase involved in cell wall biosynthesis